MDRLADTPRSHPVVVLHSADVGLLRNRNVTFGRALYGGCRPCEWIATTYFAYTAALYSLREPHRHGRLAVWGVPIAVWAMATLETKYSRRWSRVVRDWAVLALLLVAYFQADWFRSEPLRRIEGIWVAWDHAILQVLGPAVERFGGWVPSLLEGCYLSLYAIPPLSMAALYLCGQRKRADRFLTTLFAGALCVYALLPAFPTVSPRLAFPGADLPHYQGFFHSINVFLLDHFDIATSVFPSGHVAVAFSAAFGLVRAIPERRSVCIASFVAATAVFLATIYGRYHYAADGAASLTIAFCAFLLTRWCRLDG